MTSLYLKCEVLAHFEYFSNTHFSLLGTVCFGRIASAKTQTVINSNLPKASPVILCLMLMKQMNHPSGRSQGHPCYESPLLTCSEQAGCYVQNYVLTSEQKITKPLRPGPSPDWPSKFSVPEVSKCSFILSWLSKNATSCKPKDLTWRSEKVCCENSSEEEGRMWKNCRNSQLCGYPLIGDQRVTTAHSCNKGPRLRYLGFIKLLECPTAYKSHSYRGHLEFSGLKQSLLGFLWQL